MIQFLFAVMKSRKINVSGINAITNSNGDNLSPWKIPRLIITSPSNFPFDVNSMHHFSIASLSRFLTFLLFEQV